MEQIKISQYPFDIQLCINGIDFPFNKSLLMKSKYFQNMFSKKWNASDKKFELSDPLNPDSKEKTLQISSTLYTLYGMYPMLHQDNCLEYLNYANYFTLEPFIEVCLDKLFQNFNEDNCFDFLQSFDNYVMDSNLISNCMRFIRSKLHNEKVQENFLKIPEKYQTQIINDPNIWFKSEYEKYLFASKLAKLYNFNCETSEKTKMNESQFAIEKFLSSVNFHQFSNEQKVTLMEDNIVNIPI